MIFIINATGSFMIIFFIPMQAWNFIDAYSGFDVGIVIFIN